MVSFISQWLCEAEMTRDELYGLFQEGAGKSGWKVAKDELPELGNAEVLPRPENVFKALTLIAPDKVKYLILGQDPYATKTNGEPDATGVAFALEQGRTHNIPPSLARLMKSIYPNGQGRPDLEDWRQKHQILLLNAALTVTENKPGVHLDQWSRFTRNIIKQAKASSPDVQMIAWGYPAMGILCDALGVLTWSHHPVARKSGPKSFKEFWDTPVGVELRN